MGCGGQWLGVVGVAAAVGGGWRGWEISMSAQANTIRCQHHVFVSVIWSHLAKIGMTSWVGATRCQHVSNISSYATQQMVLPQAQWCRSIVWSNCWYLQWQSHLDSRPKACQHTWHYFFCSDTQVSTNWQRNEATWDKNALYFQVSKREKLIGNLDYKDESSKVSTMMDEHSAEVTEVKDFFAWAKSRQETINTRLKFFNALRCHVCHGKGIENKLEAHQQCFEAICVLVQYDLKFHPLMEVWVTTTTHPTLFRIYTSLAGLHGYYILESTRIALIIPGILLFITFFAIDLSCHSFSMIFISSY